MDRTRFLRRALLSNAAFSVFTSTILLVEAPALAPWMGLATPWWLWALVPGLLGFAALLVQQARRDTPAPRVALAICAADAGWVLGSIALVLAPTPLTPGGRVLVLAVAAAVGLLAVAQVLGIARSGRSDGTRGPHRSMLTASRFVAAPPEEVWPIVSDLDGYHRVAPNLSLSEVISGEGEGAIRACADHAGGRWTERVVTWEPGRRYATLVDTEAEDYPYPFRTLRGEWEVAEAPGGSVVRMRFDVTLPGGLVGDLLAVTAVMPRFVPVVEAILDAWQDAATVPVAPSTGSSERVVAPAL